MAWVPESPVFVLIAVVIAAKLLLIEVALPTFGVAGGSAAVLAALAAISVASSDETWWPLVLVAAGVSLYAVVLARRSGEMGWRVAAAGSFVVGGVAFGALASDVTTVIVAAASGLAMHLGFPTLERATSKLLDRPAQVGMEALVGRRATVVQWDRGKGRVSIEGTLWGARSPEDVEVGVEVDIVGFDGMTLSVAPVVSTAR